MALPKTLISAAKTANVIAPEGARRRFEDPGFVIVEITPDVPFGVALGQMQGRSEQVGYGFRILSGVGPWGATNTPGSRAQNPARIHITPILAGSSPPDWESSAPELYDKWTFSTSDGSLYDGCEQACRFEGLLVRWTEYLADGVTRPLRVLIYKRPIAPVPVTFQHPVGEQVVDWLDGEVFTMQPAGTVTLLYDDDNPKLGLDMGNAYDPEDLPFKVDLAPGYGNDYRHGLRRGAIKRRLSGCIWLNSSDAFNVFIESKIETNAWVVLFNFASKAVVDAGGVTKSVCWLGQPDSSDVVVSGSVPLLVPGLIRIRVEKSTAGTQSGAIWLSFFSR
jgi:hypothetical protein